MQQGGEWWDRTAPLQPRGKRAAGRSGWVQTPAQSPSSCANLSTSHSLWRPKFCPLYRREAEARSTCYIVASSWHPGTEAVLSEMSFEPGPQYGPPGAVVTRGEVGAGWEECRLPTSGKTVFKNHC